MDLHEYQAKEILRDFGIPVPPFIVAGHEDEVESAMDALHLEKAVLKAQVHAGGRGKAGGIQIVEKKNARTIAKDLFNKRLVTPQTQGRGLPIHQLMITPVLPIKKEYYVALTVDRKRGVPVFIVSKEGGVEIEKVEKDKIGIFPFLITGEIRSYKLLSLIKFLGFEGVIKEQALHIFKNLAHAFIKIDAKLIEINPLIESDLGLIALDAKISLDESALYRHEGFSNFFDRTQLAENEAKAFERDLSYVSLDGEIGCLVNGAGLAMATMDLLLTYGGSPANFLDIGGAATKESIAFGFKLILLDPKVRAIFVNIFGGIVDCSVLAQAIIDATESVKIHIPVVVRLEGTNADEGLAILSASKLNFIMIRDLAHAASEVCMYASSR